MPYSDPEKQREAERLSQQRVRERKADANERIVAALEAQNEILRGILYRLECLHDTVAIAHDLPTQSELDAAYEAEHGGLTSNSSGFDVKPSDSGQGFDVKPNGHTQISQESKGLTSNPSPDHLYKELDTRVLDSLSSSSVVVENKTNDDDRRQTITKMRQAAESVGPEGERLDQARPSLTTVCPYEITLGDEYIKATAKLLAERDETMGRVRFVKDMFRIAYRDIGDAGNDQVMLETAVRMLFKAYDKQKSKITSPTGWVRTTFGTILRELVES